MKKLAYPTFLIVFVLITLIPFSSQAQTTTTVIGQIKSDTTWTKDNGPYSLTGPVFISAGVTLNIEPGVTIDLNGFYIQVNGTFHAIGSTAGDITIKNGELNFDYDIKQHNTVQSIFQNTNLESIHINIDSKSPTINGNSIIGDIHCQNTSSIISNNNITGYRPISLFQSSALIDNNTIYNECRAIECNSDKSLIINNKIYGGNTGIISGGHVNVSNNIVVGCDVGIDAGTSSTVERNLVTGNIVGIFNRGTIIRNNTICNNEIGMSVYSPSTIHYNNFENNSEYDVQFDLYADSTNIDASNNWWGTVDEDSINRKIFDYYDDYNLGKVVYKPILTEPNTEVMSDQVAFVSLVNATAIPSNVQTTPSSSYLPLASTESKIGSILDLNLVEIIIVLLLFIIVVLLVLVVFYLRKRGIGGSVKGLAAENGG